MGRPGQPRRWVRRGLGWVSGLLALACQPADRAADDRAEAPSIRDAVPSRWTMAGDSGNLGFELELEPRLPAMGQIFRITTSVFDPRSGRPLQRGTLRLDATMPGHGHGMETRPAHRPTGAGRFVSEGMKLHMPGLWHIAVEARGELDGRAVEDRAVVVYQQPIVVP